MSLLLQAHSPSGTCSSLCCMMHLHTLTLQVGLVHPHAPAVWSDQLSRCASNRQRSRDPHLFADHLVPATPAATLGAPRLCREVRASRAWHPLLPLSIGEKPGWRARLLVSVCLGNLLCVSPVPKGQMPGPTSLMMTFRADFTGAAMVAGALVGGAVEGTAVVGAWV